jgi:hypothetical protein
LKWGSVQLQIYCFSGIGFLLLADRLLEFIQAMVEIFEPFERLKDVELLLVWLRKAHLLFELAFQRKREETNSALFQFFIKALMLQG